MSEQALYRHLQEVRDQAGVLTPEVVKEANRPEGAPYHGFVFDRSVADASEAYYTARAQQLIRSCRVTFVEPGEGGPGRDTRRYHAVPSEGTPRYVYEPADEVALDPVKRALVVQEMRRRWQELKRAALDFDELADMIAADEDMRDRLFPRLVKSRRGRKRGAA